MEVLQGTEDKKQETQSNAQEGLVKSGDKEQNDFILEFEKLSIGTAVVGAQPKKRGRPPIDRSNTVCTICGAKETPEWRRSAANEPLCNACGLRSSRMGKKVLTEEEKAAGEAKRLEAEKRKAEKQMAEKLRKEQEKEAKKKQKEQEQAAGTAGEKKKDRGILGITAEKEKDFPEWYTQVITKAELIEYYDVSGCYIMRPWAFHIWEAIHTTFDAWIKKSGVQNAYFPLFVSKAALEAEESHIAGFAAEVAWVTRGGHSDLAQPIAVRPTSETIMYPVYSKWIRSHRDLPLRLNQWANVVRWEFKHPIPFLRVREFLWQEGHSAFATEEQAGKEVLEILELYRRVFEEILAVPVTPGRKTENEKFAGGDYTTTIEAFIPATGRGIQAATSHSLGQNFSKIFKIQFEDDKGGKDYAWQTSWGLTVRSIGIMIMTHGDKNGLVLPPKVAPTQVIIVPIPKADLDHESLFKACKELADTLEEAGIRASADIRDNYNPPFKWNYWELKGVPLRLDIGPNELETKTAIAVRRDNGAKEKISLDGLVSKVQEMLKDIQQSLFEKAKKTRDERISLISKWEEFVPALDKGHVVLAPWCKNGECEDAAKARSGQEKVKNDTGEAEGFKLSGAAKSLCIPFKQPKEIEKDQKCFQCGQPAKVYCMFGRSY